MKAYDFFEDSWEFEGERFQVGKTYHAKKDDKALIDRYRVFCGYKNFYDFISKYSDIDRRNHYAVIELTDNISTDDGEIFWSSTMKIVSEITLNDVLEKSNIGANNLGTMNVGYKNTGHENCGLGNSGFRNIGDKNSGYYNHGNKNTGENNFGNRNVGDFNLGSDNVGSFNKGDNNYGFFNTEQPTVRMFNKDTGLRMEDVNIPYWLNHIETAVYVSIKEATEEELIEHRKEFETFGGYIRSVDYKEACKSSWSKMNNTERMKVKELPNFNADIFYDITGIRVDQ